MSPAGLELGEGQEMHCKGAYLHDDRRWSLKVVSALLGTDGKSRLAGLSLVFDAETGAPEALLLDNGYLTELRTGAAGALAADLLCDPAADTLTIIGTGGQARYQLDALIDVRGWEHMRVVGCSPERAQAYAARARERHSCEVIACTEAEGALDGASLVVTIPSAQAPVLRGDWLTPGTHVLAVGADTPAKRELDAVAMSRAEVICVGDVNQAIVSGEVRSAVREGLVGARRADAACSSARGQLAHPSTRRRVGDGPHRPIRRHGDEGSWSRPATI